MKFRHSQLATAIERYRGLSGARGHPGASSDEDLKAALLRLKKAVDCVLSVVEAQDITMSNPTAPTAVPTYSAIEKFERISVPVAFVEKMHAYTQEKLDSEHRNTAADLALLTVYLHELSHAFMQHLNHMESSAQEIYSDFLAGALLERLSCNSRLQSILGTTISDVEIKRIALVCLVCAMPKEPADSLYLPRFLRLAIMLRGCEFALDPQQCTEYSEDPVGAISGAPVLAQDLGMFAEEVPQDHLDRMSNLINEVMEEKVGWFRESTRLRPIAKKLRELLQES